MYSKKILKELEISISKVQEEEILVLTEELKRSEKIFCDGLGRSGLVCRGFAMRLMHLGFVSMCVGDTVTTAIGEKDLLLLCSGSGESEALISHAKKAKRNGARVALVTGNANSTLGQIADIKVVVTAPGKEELQEESILPMGTLFEGTAALIFENVVLELMEQLNETSQSMFKRHANLE